MGHSKMGNSSSSSNVVELGFEGMIGPNPDFDAEASAKALHKAFHKRIGIKEDVIIEQVIRLNNEQRQEVRDVYKGCYGEDLVGLMDKIRRDDLRHGLKALMRPPAEYAARVLRKAMRGPGTDEETLIELLCTRTNAGIEAIKEAYSETHGRDLESDIESETRGDFKCLLIAILQAQRQEDEEADEDLAREQAQELYDAGEDRWGTDETTFTLTLARRSWIQLRAIILAYEEIAGNTLEEAIESECSRDLRKGYKAIVRLAGNPAFYYARTIYKALKGVGTDEITMIRHIVNSSELLLKNVKDEFLETAGYTLDKGIKKGFRGDARDLLRTVVRGNGFASEWTPEEEEEEEESEEEEEEEEEVDEDAAAALPIDERMKKGITVHNVYIMNELSGHVLEVQDGGDDGTPVIQNEFTGDEGQLFSINYYQKQAVIYSEMWPDCCLSVEEGGGPHTLFIRTRDEDNVGQLFRYSKNYIFNQGRVLDVPWSSEDTGVHIGTYARHGGDNQVWYIMQADA